MILDHGLLPFELVVCLEEHLDLVDDGGRQIRELSHFGIQDGRRADREEAVVLDRATAPGRLLGFDDANQPSWHHRARWNGFVEKENDVERIAVLIEE